MVTILIFDVARGDLRRRIEAAFKEEGFRRVFKNVFWGTGDSRARTRIVRRVRRRLVGQPYRVMLLAVTSHQLAAARWLIGTHHREGKKDERDNHRTIFQRASPAAAPQRGGAPAQA